MAFEIIKQKAQNYYDELPTQILPTIAKSAFYAFTVSYIFTSRTKEGVVDLSRPLLNAGVAALASTIHALATPVFNYLLGNKELSFLHETIKSTIVSLIASILMGCATTSRLDLFAIKIFPLISGNSVVALYNSLVNGPLAKPPIKHNSIYV